MFVKSMRNGRKILFGLWILALVLAAVMCAVPAYAVTEDMYAKLTTEKEGELENMARAYEKLAAGEKKGEIETLKILGIIYHNLGTLNVRGMADKGYACLEKAYKLSKGKDIQILAYMGSCKTMMGRDEMIPFMKIITVNEGAKVIDAAVEKAPDDLTVRTVRIENTLALPSFFKRGKYVKGDIEYLLKMQDTKKMAIPKRILTSFYYYLGNIERTENGRVDRAIECYKESIKVLPGSKAAVKSKEMLDILTGD